MNSFSIKEAVGAGWEIFKKNWRLLLLVGVVVAVISFVLPSIPNAITEKNAVLALILGLSVALLSFVVEMGVIKIELNLVDGAPAEFADLFRGYKQVVKYFLTKLIVGVLTVVGYILLIGPGIVLSVKLRFAGYLVVDKGLGPVAAMKASWEITNGVSIKLLFFGILLGLIQLLGLLAAGVGVVVAIPLTQLADISVYRKLASVETVEIA